MPNFQIPKGFTVRKTEELATITYVGHSEIGTLTTSKEWVVMKVEVVGGVSTISYGEGSWDSRATLTYK